MQYEPMYEENDATGKMYKEYRGYIEKLGNEDTYDTGYWRTTIPREYFVRMCKALKETAAIAHKLHTLAHEEPEKEPGTHWGKLEVVYKHFAEFMQWDEKRHIRVVIDYDPDAQKVLLLRCPVTQDGKEPSRRAEEQADPDGQCTD